MNKYGLCVEKNNRGLHINRAEVALKKLLEKRYYCLRCRLMLVVG